MNQEELKQRLIELVRESLYRHIDKSCLLAENVANDLIANGATIRERGEWICEVGKMNKQIEEMARELAYNMAWDEDELQTIDCLETAKRLYNAGFRKQGEWIPVTERLPKKEDANVIEGYLLAVDLKGETNLWGWKEVAHNPQWFTHWMPLPLPPEKENEDG